jgi:hypothetical protein
MYIVQRKKSAFPLALHFVTLKVIELHNVTYYTYNGGREVGKCRTINFYFFADKQLKFIQDS